MTLEYSTSRQPSKVKATNFRKSAFGDFLAPLYATKTPRGELIDTLRTLSNAGVISITCWRDLYLALAKRKASHQTIMLARHLWQQFRAKMEPRR